jgi:hypothetical protein
LKRQDEEYGGSLAAVEDGAVLEDLAVAVVAIHPDNFGDLAAVGTALQLDDELHRFTDLRGDVIAVCLLVRAHGKLAEFAQSPHCCGRMNGGHGATMTGVERIKQRASFIAADLAENDPVWTPAERRFEQIVETHGGSMRIGLTLCGQQIRSAQT